MKQYTTGAVTDFKTDPSATSMSLLARYLQEISDEHWEEAYVCLDLYLFSYLKFLPSEALKSLIASLIPLVNHLPSARELYAKLDDRLQKESRHWTNFTTPLQIELLWQWGLAEEQFSKGLDAALFRWGQAKQTLMLVLREEVTTAERDAYEQQFATIEIKLLNLIKASLIQWTKNVIEQWDKKACQLVGKAYDTPAARVNFEKFVIACLQRVSQLKRWGEPTVAGDFCNRLAEKTTKLCKKFPDFLALHEKITTVRFEIIAEGCVSDDGLTTIFAKWKYELESLRKQITSKRPLDLTALQTFSEGMKAYLKSLVDYFTAWLEDPPCEWCLLVTGSVSREDMGVLSDIDLFLLIETEASIPHPYFATLIRLLKITLTYLGEPKGLTLDWPTGNLSLNQNTPTGFSKNYKSIILSTAKQEDDSKAQQDDSKADALFYGVPLAASKNGNALYLELQKLLLSEVTPSSLQILATTRLTQAYDKYKAVSQLNKSSYNIKKEVIRPLLFCLQTLRLLYGHMDKIEAVSVLIPQTQHILHQLQKSVHPAVLHYWECLYLTAYQHRNLQHFKKLAQDDFFQREDIEPLLNKTKQFMSYMLEVFSTIDTATVELCDIWKQVLLRILKQAEAEPSDKSWQADFSQWAIWTIVSLEESPWKNELHQCYFQHLLGHPAAVSLSLYYWHVLNIKKAPPELLDHLITLAANQRLDVFYSLMLTKHYIKLGLTLFNDDFLERSLANPRRLAEPLWRMECYFSFTVTPKTPQKTLASLQTQLWLMVFDALLLMGAEVGLELESDFILKSFESMCQQGKFPLVLGKLMMEALAAITALNVAQNSALTEKPLPLTEADSCTVQLAYDGLVLPWRALLKARWHSPDGLPKPKTVMETTVLETLRRFTHAQSKLFATYKDLSHPLLASVAYLPQEDGIHEVFLEAQHQVFLTHLTNLLAPATEHGGYRVRGLPHSFKGDFELVPDLCKDLFDEKGNIRVNTIHASKGYVFDLSEKYGIFLKFLSADHHMVGRQLAVDTLQALVMGKTLHGRLLRIDYQKQSYWVWASQALEGTNLKNLTESQINAVDAYNFSRAAILDLLIHPVDAKPENGTRTEKGELLFFDNDQAFGDPLAKGMLESVVVKSFVWCMAQQMQQPLDPILITALQLLDPYLLVNRWIKRLQQIETNYQTLLTPKTAKSLGVNLETGLISLPKGISLWLYQMLWRLKKQVNMAPAQPIVTLLKRLAPEAIAPYHINLNNSLTTAERFDVITQYKTTEQGRVTHATSYKVQQKTLTHFHPTQMPATAYTLTHERKSLTKVHEHWIHRLTLLKKLTGKNQSQFLAALATIATMGTLTQEWLLHEIRGDAFGSKMRAKSFLKAVSRLKQLTVVHLNNFDHLTPAILKTMLGNNPKLVSLTLVNCSSLNKLSWGMWDAWPLLETLNFQKCPSLYSREGLTSLINFAGRCPQLQTLYAPLPDPAVATELAAYASDFLLHLFAGYTQILLPSRSSELTWSLPKQIVLALTLSHVQSAAFREVKFEKETFPKYFKQLCNKLQKVAGFDVKVRLEELFTNHNSLRDYLIQQEAEAWIQYQLKNYKTSKRLYQTLAEIETTVLGVGYTNASLYDYAIALCELQLMNVLDSAFVRKPTTITIAFASDLSQKDPLEKIIEDLATIESRLTNNPLNSSMLIFKARLLKQCQSLRHSLLGLYRKTDFKILKNIPSNIRSDFLLKEDASLSGEGSHSPTKNSFTGLFDNIPVLANKNTITVNLSFWHFSLSKRYLRRGFAATYLGTIDAILLGYDVHDRTGFENLPKHIERIKSLTKEKPINVFILVGILTDTHKSRRVTLVEASKLCTKYNFVDYFEFSALPGENLDEMFASIANRLYTQPLDMHKQSLRKLMGAEVIPLKNPNMASFLQAVFIAKHPVLEVTELITSEALAKQVLHLYQTYPLMSKLVLDDKKISKAAIAKIHFQWIKNKLTEAEDLIKLDLSHCYLTDDLLLSLLPDLKKCIKLKYLFLRSNQLTLKGVKYLCEWLKDNKSIKHLNVSGNTFEMKQAQTLLETINHHNLLQKTINIFLTGDAEAGAGKSCLMVRYVENKFTGWHPPTMAIDWNIKLIDIFNIKLRLQIWDPLGQKRFLITRKAWYRRSHIIILIFALNDKTSFEKLEFFYKEIQDYARQQTPIFLVGTKSDLKEGRKISYKEAVTAQHKYGCIDYFECSAKTGEGVEALFDAIVRYVYENLLGIYLEDAPKKILPKPIKILPNAPFSSEKTNKKIAPMPATVVPKPVSLTRNVPLLAHTTDEIDATLATETKGANYRYSVLDLTQLLGLVRKTWLDYAGCPLKNPGQEYDACRPNRSRIWIVTPYVPENFAEGLEDDIKTILGLHENIAQNQLWSKAQLPQLLIFSFLINEHWYAVRVTINYEKKLVSILWDNPFGADTFTEVNKAMLLLVLNKGLNALFSHYYSKAETYATQQYEKALVQQDNGVDCGAIVLSNIRDYTNPLITNAMFSLSKGKYFTLGKAGEPEHKAQIQRLRKRDKAEFIALKTSKKISYKVAAVTRQTSASKLVSVIKAGLFQEQNKKKERRKSAEAELKPVVDRDKLSNSRFNL